MNDIPVNRRRFLGLVGGVAGSALFLGLLPRRARAADLPHLTLADPTAKALHYVDDSSKAVAPHKAGQDCSNCMHYSGKAGAPDGPCALFPGKSVNAKGWCAGYAAKA